MKMIAFYLLSLIRLLSFRESGSNNVSSKSSKMPPMNSAMNSIIISHILIPHKTRIQSMTLSRWQLQHIAELYRSTNQAWNHFFTFILIQFHATLSTHSFFSGTQTGFHHMYHPARPAYIQFLPFRHRQTLFQS